ncbi:hypothetical protein EVV10_34840 [Pseudomonas aeruginosa]|nr:hypothetical protein EVV10_34840 [Pseudomonas aeruginosa]
MKSVIVPSVQSPPSMLKLHDFCNRASWTTPHEAERGFTILFDILGISAPDRERLAFYLRLDPLTWG